MAANIKIVSYDTSSMDITAIEDAVQVLIDSGWIVNTSYQSIDPRRIVFVLTQ